MGAASYRVTRPYATMKVMDANGAVVVSGFYAGAVVSNVEPDSLKSLLDRGIVEKVESSDFNEGGAPAKAAAPLKSSK